MRAHTSQAKAPQSDWFLVAHEVHHLPERRRGERTWWCVDRRSTPGDRAFVYKPLRGILCLFEILQLDTDQLFCKSFGMATASVRILRVFDPPIPARTLRAIPGVRQEGFSRRNFQGRSFRILSDRVPEAILAIKR